MIIKYWRKNGSFYFMKADFKYKTAYTDVIQFSLKDPWLFPKYKDDFAGYEGLRFYGWLFFYFGRVYTGLLYPSEAENETVKTLVDPQGHKWLFLPREKVVDFETVLSNIKTCYRNGKELEFTRNYHGERYDITAKLVDKK
ncbi:hypothetical protein [Lacrimispora amygdalina]|uniref:hypothetical protein n=1 Tax=Lacrimispora amygdalina TaxID=253257 RepID=UPI000BE3134D|nr:hypothetical protein [Lacrimispora amygdalina]